MKHCFVLRLLGLSLLGASTLFAQDFTDRIELLGNPLSERWGVNDLWEKEIRALEPYQGRLLIGSGFTNTRQRIDVWGYQLERDAFEHEQRINQELVVRFREFDNKIYLNNEDFNDTSANINILDGTTWTAKNIFLPNNQPFDASAVAHSRDIYVFDGKVFSSNGNRDEFPDILISENDGDTWRVARGGPVHRRPDNPLPSEEVLHFMEVGGELYLIPWGVSVPIFKYLPDAGPLAASAAQKQIPINQIPINWVSH